MRAREESVPIFGDERIRLLWTEARSLLRQRSLICRLDDLSAHAAMRVTRNVAAIHVAIDSPECKWPYAVAHELIHIIEYGLGYALMRNMANPAGKASSVFVALASMREHERLHDRLRVLGFDVDKELIAYTNSVLKASQAGVDDWKLLAQQIEAVTGYSYEGQPLAELLSLVKPRNVRDKIQSVIDVFRDPIGYPDDFSVYQASVALLGNFPATWADEMLLPQRHRSLCGWA
jgi:hypothetical protein